MEQILLASIQWIVSIAIIAIVIAGSWETRTYFKKRSEEVARKEREYLYQLRERVKTTIADKRFAVILRKTDGKQTEVETILIETLASLKAIVINICPNSSNKLLAGEPVERLLVDFVLLGKVWSEHRGGVQVLDFRIQSGIHHDKGVVVVAGVVRYATYEEVSLHALHLLAKRLHEKVSKKVVQEVSENKLSS